MAWVMFRQPSLQRDLLGGRGIRQDLAESGLPIRRSGARRSCRERTVVQGARDDHDCCSLAYVALKARQLRVVEAAMGLEDASFGTWLWQGALVFELSPRVTGGLPALLAPPCQTPSVRQVCLQS